MLSIISPAKKLNENIIKHHKNSSHLHFEDKIKELVNILKNFSVAEIAQLMKLSEKLARLNFERYQDFNLEGSQQQPSSNALFLFQGDVYQSLDAGSLNSNEINFAQDHLSILSGLYGLIKPLDLVQPYRLEMGTKLNNNSGKDLYSFWQNELTSHINKILSKHKNKILLNLASNEYFKAINLKSLNYPVVTVHFKEQKAGQLKVIGIHAKKARGALARFIITNKIDNLENVLNFTELDYNYKANLSDESNIVFTR